MCTQPVKVRNLSRCVYTYEEGRIKETSHRLLSEKSYIEVPCGKCDECKRSHYSSYLQRAQMESMNAYVYMLTLTYDDAHIPSISFITDDGPVSLYHCDIKHIQDMFKRVRKYTIFADRDFRYFYATEYGTTKFRPHFHALFFVSKLDSDSDTTPRLLESELYNLFRNEWRVNIGTRRAPIYEPLFTFAQTTKNGKIYSNYDLHLVTDEVDDDSPAILSATQYLIGYLLKSSNFDEYLTSQLDAVRDILPHDIYTKIRGIVSSRVYFSKGFGFSFDKSTGKKVMLCVSYMRCNPFYYQFWRIYNILPDTFQEFQESYSYSVYIEFQDKLLNRLRSFNNFVDLCNSFSTFELFYFVAHYKYQRSIFEAIIHRHSMDISTFSLNLFPQGPYDDSYKSSDVYKFVRRGVDDSHKLGLPFMGFRTVYKKKDVYLPLCKFYKRYVCKESDFINVLFRQGYFSIDDLEFEPTSDTQRIKLADLNQSAKDVRDISINSNPYRKLSKKCSNFLFIQKKCIFVPTFETISTL